MLERIVHITATVDLPGCTLDEVEAAATGGCDLLLELERETGLDLGPTCAVDSRTNRAYIYFTVNTSTLKQIGKTLAGGLVADA